MRWPTPSGCPISFDEIDDIEPLAEEPEDAPQP